MGAFEGKTCPMFSEATEYLAKHNPIVNKTMSGHEQNVQKWIEKRLNLNVSIDEQWAKRIIDEMITNNFEQRYVPYQQLTPDEWIKLYNYLSDYAYIYLFESDSIVKVLSSELMEFMLTNFEGKAKASLGLTSKNTEYLKRRKYSYLSGRGTEIPMIFQAFKLREEDRIIPKFATSFVFELWKKKNASNTYNRNDFYVRIFLDDKPQKMTEAVCDEDFHCAWDSVASYMQGRIISKSTLDRICFSHLDYSDNNSDTDNRQQWIAAFFISLPLTLATVYISRYIYNTRCFKSRNSKNPSYSPLRNKDEEDEDLEVV